MLRKISNLEKQNLNILFNILMAFIIRGGALFVSLFTLPAYLRYFNNQALLGMWFTILSVFSWILYFDLGIGNGLRNKLVDTFVNKDNIKTKQYISSAYIIISSYALVAVLLGYVMSAFINWNSFFNISENYLQRPILLQAVRIVFLGIVIQFVLRIITSILYALQKSFVPNLLNLASSTILVLYVSNASSSSVEHNIVMLAYANVIAINLPLLVATILVFATKLRNCLPSIKMFNRKYASDIMKLGGTFFYLQIIAMIIYNTNEFLISWFLGPSMVVNYQIYNKIFTLGGTLVTLTMTPIWSAVTKAKVENNYKWISKLNNRLMLLGAAGVCVELILVPFLQIILNLWLGDRAIKVDYLYASIFAISGSLLLWATVITQISNGLGELKIQLIFMTIGAIVNFPLAYIGAKLLNSYIAIVIANIISLTPYCIIQPISFNSFLKKKFSG